MEVDGSTTYAKCASPLTAAIISQMESGQEGDDFCVAC